MTKENENKEFLSYNEVKNYYKDRIIPCASIGGLLGLSSGYFIGDLGLRLGTAWTIAGGVIGFQYFTTTLLLKLIRNKDDVSNYGISGGLTTITAIKYLELSNIIPKSHFSSNIGAIVIGISAGMLYKFTESSFFELLRETWISRRHYLKHVSKPILTTPRKGVIPRELMGKVPPLPEGVTFQSAEEYEEEQKKRKSGWGFN